MNLPPTSKKDGRKSRCQSELSTDDWGRRIENPLDKTRYLVKASANNSEKFNLKIKVLFEDNEHFYFVNIVDGVNMMSAKSIFSSSFLISFIFLVLKLYNIELTNLYELFAIFFF